MKNLNWLPGLDSNQGFQLQRLTCYPYTTGHCGMGRLRNYLFAAVYSRFVGYQRQGAGSRDVDAIISRVEAVKPKSHRTSS